MADGGNPAAAWSELGGEQIPDFYVTGRHVAAVADGKLISDDIVLHYGNPITTSGGDVVDVEDSLRESQFRFDDRDSDRNVGVE